MKKNKIIYLVTLLFVIVGCEDYLDTKIDNNYDDELTWSLPQLAEGVLMQAYQAIPNHPDKWAGNNFIDVATDNAITNDYSSGLYKLCHGGQTPQTNPLDNWGTAYNQIRNINLFLEKGLDTNNIKYDISDSEFDSITRSRLIGEAYFLRAWWQMDLLRRFGGISNDGIALGFCIVTKVVTEEDETNIDLFTRNTFEECVQQILDDCDLAIDNLPLAYDQSSGPLGNSQVGRATEKAAYALKSRVALLGASPAYQPDNATPTEINNKWIRAAQLANAAIDSCNLGGYELLTEDILSGTTALQDNTPAEFIFRRWTNNNEMEQRQFPPMFFGKGKTHPSQNLVDAFPASNGYPISHNLANYDPQNPYENRDSRLNLTVYYNNKPFGKSSNSAYRNLEIYYDSLGNPGRDAEGYNYQNTRTGYYVRKWVSANADLLYNPSNLGKLNDHHQHPLLRRAEVYYNLAEALNEAQGPDIPLAGITLTAFDIISDIRNKAGLVTTGTDDYLISVRDAGKDAFRELILNERRIEFAFEDFRFFDLRRHKLPLDEEIRGMKATKLSTGFVYEGTDPNGTKIVVEERNALDNDKYRYSPMPYGEMVKNNYMVNNRGW